jgi:hypothetical protein
VIGAGRAGRRQGVDNARSERGLERQRAISEVTQVPSFVWGEERLCTGVNHGDRFPHSLRFVPLTLREFGRDVIFVGPAASAAFNSLLLSRDVVPTDPETTLVYLIQRYC